MCIRDRYGGLDYARNKMNDLRAQAFEILENIAPESIYKENIKNLVNFVIDRES